MFKLKRNIFNLSKKISNKYRPDARDNYLERIELSYLYNIFNLYKEVESCPGNIIELGVGAGRNAILFGNLIRATGQHASARYFGFDTFGSYTPRDLELESNLDPNKWANNSYEFVSERIERHGLKDISKLINGDIRKTIPQFIGQDHPKKSNNYLYCRLIYVDCSAYEPAKIALDILWEHIVPGGIIAIDQRTQGGEWKAGIEFCQEKNIKPYSPKDFNGAPVYIRKDS